MYVQYCTYITALKRSRCASLGVKRRIRKTRPSTSFEVAQHVFSDPLHLSIEDRHEDGQERWQTIDMVGGVALLLVAHTYNITDEEEYHIISARKADAGERKRYASGTV
jgi:uncharacterized protein